MPRRWSKQRFDLVEVIAIAAFSTLFVWKVGTFSLPPEAAPLRKVYGPWHYTRGVEEWVIRDYFKDQRAGFFVDIGANHYKDENNTFYLEQQLGWSGIAVDPLREFEADYGKYRPRTKFFALFVSDVSDERAALYVAQSNTKVSSASREQTEDEAGQRASVTMVPTITLTDLLEGQGVSRVDLLSIDIELAEPKALAGFDVDKFKPRLVCIEAWLPVRQQILDYFARHRYVVIGRYLRADPINLYFAPFPDN